MEGDPKYEASQVVPNVAYAQFAELIGLRGIFIDEPGGLHDAWRSALNSDRPVVLEVKTDPDVAPLPPHITIKEARNFVKAMAGGDPSVGNVLADTARQIIGR